MTPSSNSLLARRHRAEIRFRRYGQCAIFLALLALVLLLGTIIERGWQGFFRTEVRLTLELDAAAIGNDPKTIRHADMSPYIRRALLKRFAVSGERREMRELVGLISSGATQTVRNALLADPSLMTGSHTLWLPASDAVDRAIKWNETLKTPAIARKITDRQLAWLDALKADGTVRKVFNLLFFTSGDSREPELAGFAASIVGSVLTLLSCMLLAFPVGVMAAMYLEEFAPKTTLTEWIEISVNNLAAVPSVVFGLLGLAVYLNVLGIPRSASLAGGLTLALMILPTIIIATRASLRAIPDSIRDAARGLGASPLQVVLHHSFPLAIPGIMTGTILGIARAMGETAPLLMIGMVAFVADIPTSLTDPATSMPVQIYLWATSPEQSFVEKTAAGIIVLLAALILLNSLAIFIRKRFEHRW
jgi:phosphate transport system permease protein